MFKPSVSFKIYGRAHSMTLKKFCKALGLGTTGSSKKIQAPPADLLDLYQGITTDEDRRAQRGKIKNIQLPAIRYFAYYLATTFLGRENTSNISNYQLAFLAAALNNEDKYNLGSFIARRLAAKGPIYGGIIATRVATALNIDVDPHDTILVQQRLDLAAMKAHHFVTTSSTLENLVYRMMFIDGEEREIPLPQTTLFSISQGSWSRSKEEMDDKLCFLNFHGHYQEEAPS